MRILTAKLKNTSGFFFALVCFGAVLPFSEALVSVFGGGLLLVALIEDNWRNKWERMKKNKILLFLPAIYLIYLMSAFCSADLPGSVYDLRKNLFFLIIPVAFALGKEVTREQKRTVFFVFSAAVLTATLVALLRWKIFPFSGVFEVHKISLISHIRFSFQLVLAFWFFVLLIFTNYRRLGKGLTSLYSLLALYLAGFLLFQQSLTGIAAMISSILLFVFWLILRKPKSIRGPLLVVAIALVSIPVVYVSHIIVQFYDFEKVDEQSIDKYTIKGNPYNHDFDNPMVENGNFVYLYVCKTELREEWNKISSLKYDSLGQNGFPVYSTLIRYMTSKGLRKDAEGIQALTQQDIRNIEKGIANVIYQQKRFSLYPRIYQSIWEYHVYSHTGYANNQSLSQRIEFAKAAIAIIRDNFWLGVGTARWKEAFKNAYVSNDSKLDPEFYASSHNQYLNYGVKFGVAGLVAILFFLVFPVIYTRRYADLFFLTFLIFMFFVNFADSNFESHMGSSFFVFFYCLFLITDGLDYLKIEEPFE